MPQVTTTTNVTLAKGKSIVFSLGGLGSVNVLVGQKSNDYKIGAQEVFLGPFDRAASLTITPTFGEISYGIDEDGVNEPQNYLKLNGATMEVGGVAATAAQKSAFMAGVGIQQQGIIGTIASLGDSRSSNSFTYGGTPAKLNASINRTAIVWLNYMLGGPWKWVQPEIAAVAGERTDEWADGSAAILALSPRPDFVYIGFPTNDVAQGVEYATIVANLDAYITQHLANGSKVILQTAGSNGANDYVKLEKISKINSWIAAKASSIGALVVDTFTPTANPSTGFFTAGMSSDGTHEIPLGGYTQAKYNLKRFTDRLGQSSRFSKAWFWDTAADNPTMEGNTSGLPDLWTAYGTLGTRSKVARTDIPGEFAQVVFTSASDTEESGWRQNIQLTGAWAATTGFNKGKRILSNGNHWVVTTNGTTGSTAPSDFAAASTPGQTVSDGSVIWTRIKTITPGLTEITIFAELAFDGSGNASPRVYATFTGASAPDITFFRAMSIVGTEASPPIFTPISGVVPVIVSVSAIVPASATDVNIIICARASSGTSLTAKLGRVIVECVNP